VNVIEPKALKTTTKGQGTFVKIEPSSGTTWWEFLFGGESWPAPLKANYKVVGTVRGVPNGATTIFNGTEILESETLRVNSAAGPLMGLIGTVTISGTDPSNPGTGTWPLAVAT
jgi:hypothetical protein